MQMLAAENFNELIELILNFFQRSSGEAATADEPFRRPEKEAPLLLEFTGIVGVSGKHNGCIYYTASAVMLNELAASMLGESGSDSVSRAGQDLVGEIANVIGGNAQYILGGGCEISAPIIFQGLPRNIRLPIYAPASIVPIHWRSHKSYAVFGLNP